MELTIECHKRKAGSKPNALRREGIIPAALYGHQGAESVSLTITAKTAERMLKAASINNTLITLQIPDISWDGKALLREVQTHPSRGFLQHVSFFAVTAKSIVDVVVPVNFVGEPAGVKQEGGVLEMLTTEMHLQCRADSIPEAIEIDISNLNVGENLNIGQIVVPDGVTVTDDPETTVVSVQAPRIAVAGEGEAAEESTPGIGDALAGASEEAAG